MSSLAVLLRDALARVELPDHTRIEIRPGDDGSLILLRTDHERGPDGSLTPAHVSETTCPPLSLDPFEPARLTAWSEAWARAQTSPSPPELTPALLLQPSLVTVDDFAAAQADRELCHLLTEHAGASADDTEEGDPWERANERIWAHDFVSLAAMLDQDPELVQARDASGFTLLHQAAERGQDELLPTAPTRVVALLLARGADPHATNESGHTPMHLARAPVVPLLVQAGADVDARDEEGGTPLHLQAAEPEGLASMRALLAAGADPSAVNHSGERPVDLARQRHEGDKVALLEQALASIGR